MEECYFIFFSQISNKAPFSEILLSNKMCNIKRGFVGILRAKNANGKSYTGIK